MLVSDDVCGGLRRGAGPPPRVWLSAAVLVAGLSAFASHPAAAQTAAVPLQPPATSASFHSEAASKDVRDLVQWVLASGDNHGLPFMVVDKVDARVLVFDRSGDLKGAAAALLGLARGDDSAAGVGERPLSAIAPAERTTPAGRFEAALGRDLEQDILWIDYAAALSLHRVIVGNPKDRRAARLASPSVLDNRISFGCINVPPAFYDNVVVPAFTNTVGIVYILPETKPLRAVFAIP